MISKPKITLFGAALLLAGAGFSASAQASISAPVGAPTEISSQDRGNPNTTRVPRSKMKMMKRSKKARSARMRRR